MNNQADELVQQIKLTYSTQIEAVKVQNYELAAQSHSKLVILFDELNEYDSKAIISNDEALCDIYFKTLRRERNLKAINKT